MTTAERLKKAGFSFVSRRKCGMYTKVFWQDSVTHEVWSQGYAVAIMDSRNDIAKRRKTAAEG